MFDIYKNNIITNMILNEFIKSKIDNDKEIKDIYCYISNGFFRLFIEYKKSMFFCYLDNELFIDKKQNIIKWFPQKEIVILTKSKGVAIKIC